MDRLSPSEQNRNAIVNSLVSFLDPETTRQLRASTRGYKAAVTGAGSMQHLARRRVQEIVGEDLADIAEDKEHDWDLTYRLLTTDPFALYYTGNETDVEIARKMGAPMPGVQNITASSVLRHMQEAARNGWLDVFKVLLKEEENRLTGADYALFIFEALTSEKLNIFSLEEMTLAMSIMSEQDFQENLEGIVDKRVSPYIADFFLSHVPRFDTIAANSAIYEAVRNGLYALMRVFLKHNLVELGRDIDGEGYASEDPYYGRNWNPLWLAAKHGKLNIVELLLSDPRSRDIELNDYALDEAVNRGNVEIVKLMLDSIAEIENTYLNDAVLSDNLEMVKLLLSYPSTYFDYVGLQAALVTAVDNDYTWIAATLLKDPRIGSISSEIRKHLMASAEFNGNETLMKMLRSLE